MSSRETSSRTSGVDCSELEEAVAEAERALRDAGLMEPTSKEVSDVVWLGRNLGHDWPIGVHEAADIIAHRRRSPPLPSPYDRRRH